MDHEGSIGVYHYIISDQLHETSHRSTLIVNIILSIHMKRSRDATRRNPVMNGSLRNGVCWRRRVSGVILLGAVVASLSRFHVVVAQQNPLTMNGGSVLAMAGKNCVVLAVDRRFGSGRSLINVRKRPILQIPPTSIVAFTGMEGDVQSLHIELNAQIIDKYYRGLGFGERSTCQDTNRQDATSLVPDKLASIVSVKAVTMLTSHILYRRRRAPYFVEPVVIGLKPDGWEEQVDDVNESDGTTSSMLPTLTINNKDRPSMNYDSASLQELNNHMHPTLSDSSVTPPNLRPGRQRRIRYRPYVCGMDMIGARSESDAFCCAGTASKSLYGTAEALWEPNLSPDQLVSICTNAFLSALERDCLSGYGATVYLLTPDGITEYDVSGRSD